MIHRLWLGAGPPDMAWTTRTLQQLHPDVEVVEHRQPPAEAVELAAATAHLVYPDERQQARHVANVARLVLLRDLGGWWADYDLVPLVPFTSLPSPASAEHRDGTRCNCWLAFPAGHPALTAALDRIRLAYGPPGSSTLVSGERMLTDVWGPEVARLPLTVDSDGLVTAGVVAWAVHLCGTLRGQ